MSRWRIRASTVRLRGSVALPADRDITRAGLFLASVADGTSTLSGRFAASALTESRALLAALGVETRVEEETVSIRGVGIHGLTPPRAPLDAPSAPVLSLLCGLLAGRAFDATLRCASAPRIASLLRPLRSRGARIDGVFDAAHNDEVPPVSIRALSEGARLGALEHALTPSEPFTKSALLLSALTAGGPTALTEPLVTPDHTERMLDTMGAPIRTMASALFFDPDGWDQRLVPVQMRVPGDPACAVLLVVAAHVVANSHVIVRGVSVNPTRTGALEVLRHMGARVIVEPRGASAGEPSGDLHVGAFEPPRLRTAARVSGELAMRARDSVAAIAVAAAVLSKGTSTIEDIAVDELARIGSMLRAFSVDAAVNAGVLRVKGGARIASRGAISSGGDSWIALAAATLALGADGETVVEDVARATERFPDFVAMLRHLGANIVEEN